MTYRYLQLDYLDNITADDQATRRKILDLLAKDLRQHPQLMRQSLEDEQWDRLELQSHYFKSSLLFTGYRPLLQANSKLHQLLKAGKNRNSAASLLQQIQRLSSLVLKEVEVARR